MGDMRLDHGLLLLNCTETLPTPITAVVGHSLAAAHDPVDDTTPSVDARSIVDSHKTHEDRHTGQFETNLGEPRT
jgi:hypothetical protein